VTSHCLAMRPPPAAPPEKILTSNHPLFGRQDVVS
jgi:hypothetical protein